MAVIEEIAIKANRAVQILEEISLPAAPFHEQQVARALLKLIERLTPQGLTWELDCFGNIIAAWRRTPADNPAQRPIVFMAHMDHPGFQVVRHEGGVQVTLEILGGVPRDLLAGAPIEILTSSGVLHGQISEPAPEIKAQGFTSAVLTAPPGSDLTGAPAVFSLEPFRIEGDLVFGRAMDDLAGCAMGLGALERIVQERLPIDAYLILHRAEETGMLGAYTTAQSGRIPRAAVVISLEASRVMEGAEIHKGPVIRQGDKSFWFHPDSESPLVTASGKLAQQGIAVQRRRLTGGTCEASIYQAAGYEATGVAAPLLNYHNRGAAKIEPEAISVKDLVAGVDLLVETARSLPSLAQTPRSKFLSDRQRLYEKSRERLLGAFL